MDLLAYDPWVELASDTCQPGCPKEAGLLQPLPLENAAYLRYLRSVWAALVLADQPIPPACLKTSHRSEPLSAAISHLLRKQSGLNAPPLDLSPQTLPLGEQCQLALLRGIAGEGGCELGQTLLPFLPFPSLFCPEGAYKERESLWSIALLLRSFGKYIPIPENPDPFFLALAKLAPKWEVGNEENASAILCENSGISAALALAGKKIPLGALHSGSVAVPAFGPQVYPLNDPKGFGMDRALGDGQWAKVAAQPEIWFEIHPHFERGILETRFIGSKAAFVFSIKAERAQIGGESFLPKSLQRYSGPPKKALFEKGKSALAIECSASARMELIPLAGEGCFWNAEFLLAFEIPPLTTQMAQMDGRVSFKFESNL